MDQGQIVDIAQRTIYVASIVGLPLLAVCLAVGVLVSIFQAVTQIHEQSLTFVPKIVAIAIMLLVLGNWMSGQLASFTREVFNAIVNMT